jgi:hypothetical protein
MKGVFKTTPLTALMGIGAVILNFIVMIVLLFIDGASFGGAFIGGILAGGIVGFSLIMMSRTKRKATHSDHSVCKTTSKITESDNVFVKEYYSETAQGSTGGGLGGGVNVGGTSINIGGGIKGALASQALNAAINKVADVANDASDEGEG